MIVHHPLDDHLPHPLVLVSTLLLEEVHHLMFSQVPQPLPLPEPDIPGTMEVSESLQQHIHVSSLHSTSTCSLDHLQINKLVVTTLLQVFHQDDALLLGLPDEAAGEVLPLVVAVGEVNLRHNLQQSLGLFLADQFAKLTQCCGEK